MTNIYFNQGDFVVQIWTNYLTKLSTRTSPSGKTRQGAREFLKKNCFRPGGFDGYNQKENNLTRKIRLNENRFKKV